METGRIPTETIPGAFDLEWTLESGQTFLWRRVEEDGGESWFRTVSGGDVIEVRQTDAGLDWRASGDPVETLRERLDLDTDLSRVLEAFPADPVVQAAVKRFRGLRVVTEPFVPTLISFILSAQMRIDRIHDLVTDLRRTYGDSIEWRDGSVSTFPSPTALADTSEAELRDLGLGYRAPYVNATAAMLRDGTVDVAAIETAPYETARSELTEFVGVGPKVADCVLLFSMGFPEPVPLDTWIQTAIEEHFPDTAQGSYADTSRAIRDRLGPQSGYAQTYVFTHLRTGGDAT